MGMEEWQCGLRRQFAEQEHLTVQIVDDEIFTGEYRVLNPKSGQEYKVVYRGEASPWNYCSCMDFKTSQLGTCKHIEAVKLQEEQKSRRLHVYTPTYTSVYLSYRHGRQVSIRIGSAKREQFIALAKEYFDSENHLQPEAYQYFDSFLAQAAIIDSEFRCYPDAMDFVLAQREKDLRERLVESKYSDAELDTLLKTKLYSYQKEGIRFAAMAGRTIIADEMGLGKTIQAIGTAELLIREGFVENVLVVCPTSLKYQWKREIERFTDNAVLVIEGGHTKRREQYSMPQTYKIVSYNSVCNDLKLMRNLETDMVIMDEVQRLKNWDTQIARSARRIMSPYTVLLSGTPLENKLEELYSIVELVDQFCLGPYYLFRDQHIMVNETGKVVGYKSLSEINKKLAHVMVRRRKQDVSLQLPERLDQNLLVPMTPEQREIHDEFKSSVARLVFKWQRMHFLSETDRKRLMLLLSKMRMVCDSSYILDQSSRYDTKIDELMNIIGNILEGSDEKVVVFSSWERMTRLVAAELRSKGINFEYLHGGVPSVKRKDLVSNFTDNADCRVFLSTDAGSTGLNLQAASKVINLDLPWNPAVLEQRIARVYRIGQQRNIQVINLVSAQSFEEGMIERLKFKSSLFEGVLDGGEDTIFANNDKFNAIMSIVSDFVTEETDTIEVAESIEKVVENGIVTIESDIQEDTAEETVRTDVTTLESVTHKRGSQVAAVQLSMYEDQSFLPEENKHVVSKEKQVASSALATETHDTEAVASTPDELINHGVSFLSNLVRTLSQPEATEKLVDTLVKEDVVTGQTSINIPVQDKQTVRKFLNLVGQLLKL